MKRIQANTESTYTHPTRSRLIQIRLDKEGNINFAACRFCVPLLIAFCLLTLGQGALAQESPPPSQDRQRTIPPSEHLTAGDFECKNSGYRNGDIPDDFYIDRPNHIPNGWEITATGKMPVIDSARIYFAGSCDGSAHVERMAGEDSVLIQALDIEWSAEPGKPFDVTLLQQLPAISGTGYSLSGWMLTLCGGSFSDPNDCPENYYMAKLLGIDPTGGIDPNAPTVEWVENRRNFVEADGRTRVGWQNLRTASAAQALTLTVFARINSPFRWHGNHGFIDALSVVRAPTAVLTAATEWISPAPPTITVTWQGSLGPDIPQIPDTTHRLLFDLEYWNSENNAWQQIASDIEGDGTLDFAARCADVTYRFRIQPRAEQPDANHRAQPNQRYPGLWVESSPIVVPPSLPGPSDPFTATHQIFMPAIRTLRSC